MVDTKNQEAWVYLFIFFVYEIRSKYNAYYRPRGCRHYRR